jgi:hypothetical protein
MTKFGSTGDFPRGKLSETDQGGLNVGIAVLDRTLVINFGTPIVWIGLDYHSAVQFAETILKRAEDIAPKEPSNG